MEDKGRRLFLSTLEEVCRQTGWRIHAYVLMSNHYHLLMETPEANLVAGMKWFQGTYTQRFNTMFECRGHLFQGRYKALPVETDGNEAYFAAAANYIHLNPFRAGVAGAGLDKPLEAYPWSSYPAYAGQGLNIPEWLERDRLLCSCGFKGSRAPSDYKAWMERRMSGSIAESPVAEQLEKQLKRGWFVGGDAFKKRLTQSLPNESDNLRGSQRRAHDEATAEQLLRKALHLLRMTEEELCALRNSSAEKQAVVWLLKKHTTVEVTWLSSRLNMGHRTTASRAISHFERASEAERAALKEKMLQITG